MSLQELLQLMKLFWLVIWFEPARTFTTHEIILTCDLVLSHQNFYNSRNYFDLWSDLILQELLQLMKLFWICDLVLSHKNFYNSWNCFGFVIWFYHTKTFTTHEIILDLWSGFILQELLQLMKLFWICDLVLSHKNFYNSWNYFDLWSGLILQELLQLMKLFWICDLVLSHKNFYYSWNCFGFVIWFYHTKTFTTHETILDL